MTPRIPMMAAVTCLMDGAGRRDAGCRQDHPGQYSQTEIDAGARVYSSQCASATAERRSGLGRRSAPRPVPARHLRRGSGADRSATASPAPACRRRAAAGGDDRGGRIHPRRVRSRRRPVRSAAPRAGKAIVEGKGGCLTCHRDQGQRPARGAGSHRRRRGARGRRALPLAHRSLVRHDADQPAGPNHDEGWPDDQRPAPERGHLHRADHRREGAAAVARQERHRSYVVETKSPMPSYRER